MKISFQGKFAKILGMEVLDVPWESCQQNMFFQAGAHFVLRGKNAGNFELLSYFEVTCYGRVSSGWGYYTLLKFVRHLLFTQLQIPRVMLGRMVGTVSKHERIPKWMCVSEEVYQGLVVSFTID